MNLGPILEGYSEEVFNLRKGERLEGLKTRIGKPHCALYVYGFMSEFGTLTLLYWSMEAV